MQVDIKDAAVVVWMPEGEKPSLASFEQDYVQGPPTPNPQAWWELGPALASACVTSVEGKAPWIKVGGEVLTPTQILAAYDQYRAFASHIRL